VAVEIAEAPDVSAAQAPVAIMFDYDADFAWTVQPHGRGLDYFWLVFDTYRALRALGQSIDILPPDTRDFSGYRVVVVPGMMHMPKDLKDALGDSDARVVVGPRSGARDGSMRIPTPLPPDLPGLDVTVSRVESLREDMPVALHGGGAVVGYREALESTADVIERTEAGEPVMVGNGSMHYLAGWLDQAGFRRVFSKLCADCGLEVMDLPDGVRVRDTGVERFWFNYDIESHEVAGLTLEPTSVMRVDIGG